MKKITNIILCLSLGLFLFSGCAKKEKDISTVTLWHWMTDRHEVFEKLAQQYEDETGIKVKIDLYAPSDAYTQRVIASAQARVLPDIFGVLDKKAIFASFIKNGFVADLTQEFLENNGQWEKNLFTKALDVNRFREDNIYNIKPGIYGVPIDVTNIQMLYNKKLLNDAGFDAPPKTFKEFIAMSEALKKGWDFWFSFRVGRNLDDRLFCLKLCL